MLTTEALTETINKYREILEAHQGDDTYKGWATMKETLDRAAALVNRNLERAEILVLHVECLMSEAGYIE